MFQINHIKCFKGLGIASSSIAIVILVAGSLQVTADEPIATPANPGENGVQISLKPVPAQNESTVKSREKSDSGEGEKKLEKAAENKEGNGTVELKLLPQNNTEEGQPPEKKADGSNKVKIELIPPSSIETTLPMPSESVGNSPNNNNSSIGESPKNTLRDGDPGDPGDAEIEPQPLQAGDVPLVDQAQPFDAPKALATDDRPRKNRSTESRVQSERDRERDQRISAVIDYYRTHPENIVRRGPWALMHTILPYGVEAQVIAGTRQVNTIGWLTHNGIAGKQRMFQPTTHGFRTNVGPGVQGHEGQFLAILAQSHVSPDYPIQVGNRKYTVHDLIRYEMAGCREKSELTFKLIAFSHYLQPQQTWKDNRGRPWSIEKLVAEELAQPINGEACGGTHRLMGLTCAVVSRQEAGLPLTGQFQRADLFLNDYVEYTLSLQNSDGSFSTEWFERRADEVNLDRKVQTTGHILEWLVYTLPDQQLRMPEIEKAIDFLLDSIGRNPSRDWPIGPRGHALRALVLFQNRLYRGQTLTTETNLAKQPGPPTLQR